MTMVPEANVPILSVSYDLKPPSATSAPPNLSTTTTHEIPLHVKSPPESGQNSDAYYAALQHAIAEAKGIAGGELTAWRDAVGDGEKGKTGGKVEEMEEGDEAEEEEEEGA